jgi:hypothetical protein
MSEPAMMRRNGSITTVGHLNIAFAAATSTGLNATAPHHW